MNADKSIQDQITLIKRSLETIEEHLAWLIRADARFRVGQRVEWSRKGRKQGFPRRKIAQRGTVLAVRNTFGILVKLDGMKKESSYHHSFFNPVNGPKLF